MRLISELRRRNVLRMVVLYAVTAWLIMQVVGVIMDLAKLPDWIGIAVLGLLAVGFPIALILSWFYEITPEGISLEKDVDRSDSSPQIAGRRFNVIVISLLCAAVIMFAWDKWWVGPPPEKSIAVLAFENMSGDSDQEYFSDGISEELLSLLAQIPELRVISRSSSFSFKGRDIDIPTVAEQLHVAYVLAGSMRKDDNRVRITAQLIEASSDFQIWSQSYDREFDDIFAVQTEIAGAISEALKVELALIPDDANRPDLDAYDAYLRGRELIRLRDDEFLEDAIRYLELAVRLENDFAPAHAQLAIAIGLYRVPGKTVEDMIQEAIPHLDRAFEIEPDLAEAHAGRALLALSVDPSSAIEHARKALATNPNYADAMYWLHLALSAVGEYEEANTVLQRLLSVDPLSIVGRYSRAHWLSRAGRTAEAHAIADQFIAEGSPMGNRLHADTSLNREGRIADSLYWALMGNDMRGAGFAAFLAVGEYGEARRSNIRAARWIDAAEGRFDTGLEESQLRLQRNPDDRRAIWERAEFLYEAGRIDEALPLYERLRKFVPEGRPIPSSIADHSSSNETTMRLALARRKAGDEAGAMVAAKIVRDDHAAHAAAGVTDQFYHRTDAMIAAFDGDTERVIEALNSALQVGLRDPHFFDDAVFEKLWNNPRFIAAQNELETTRVAERRKLLQMICFENPTPDNWQPMPETCDGVVDQRAL